MHVLSLLAGRVVQLLLAILVDRSARLHICPAFTRAFATEQGRDVDV